MAAPGEGDLTAADLQLLRDYLSGGGCARGASHDAGYRLIWLAAESGRISALKLLCGAPANVVENFDADRGFSRHGNTPLHIAAQNGHGEACSVLLATKRSNPTAINLHGRTPLELAVIADGTVANVDTEEESDSGTINFKAASAVSALLSAGVPPEPPDFFSSDASHSNRTALHLAAGYGRTSVAKLLLAAGANSRGCCQCSADATVDSRTDQHEWLSPLQLAARRGHLGIVQLLVQHGAYPDYLHSDAGGLLCQRAPTCRAPACYGDPEVGGHPTACECHRSAGDRRLCIWSPYLLAADARHADKSAQSTKTEPFAALPALRV
eukprot:SAG31_NODE_9300_length_1302_cov_1.271820_1_plen_325_part_00